MQSFFHDLKPANWIFRRRIVVTLGVSVIAMFAIVVYVSSLINDYQIQAAGEELSVFANLQSNVVAGILETQVLLLDSIATTDAVIEAIKSANDSYNLRVPINEQIAFRELAWASGGGSQRVLASDAAQELIRLTERFEDIQELHIIDRYGVTVASASEQVDFYEGDDDWFTDFIVTGARHITAPKIEEEGGEYAIEMVVPVYDPETQRLIGGVALLYKLQPILDVLNNTRISESGHAHIIDRQGYFITADELDEIGERVNPAALLGGRIFDGVGYELNAVDEDNSTVISGFAPVTTQGRTRSIDNLGWTMWFELPREEAIGPFLENRRYALVVFATLIGITSVVVVSLISTLTKSLKDLMLKSRELGSGNLDARFEIKPVQPPEIRTMGDSFNVMAQQIQTQTLALQAEKQRTTEQNVALLRSNYELAVARRAAEEATRVKSDFLATMSHELRTPLNAIIGYTEINLYGIAGELNDEQRDNHQRILVNANNLVSLINDILDISKIEAGRVEITNRPYAPRELMKEVIYQTQSLLEGSTVTLNSTFDSALPEKVLGDYNRVKQVVINLLSNAVKFTERGSINLRFEKQDDAWWNIIVEDTGVGIPSHALDYIFEEFRQVDGSTTRKFQGTGLGLAIVRRLILLMSGKITVKSRIGEGSTFTVTLPLVTEEIAETIPAVQ